MDATNGQFAHCPLPRKMGDKGYYLLWEHHQQQGLLQSRDVGRCCFFVGHAKQWLESLDYFPDNYFELWDIFEDYCHDFRAFQTEVSLAKGVKTRRKKGGYPKNPEWLNSPQSRQKQIETLKQLYQTERGIAWRNKQSKKMSKPIEVTFENGRIGIYPSAKFAAAALGICRSSLCCYLKGKQKPTLPISVRYV